MSPTWAAITYPPSIGAGGSSYLPILAGLMLYLYARKITSKPWTITINFGFWAITIAYRSPRAASSANGQGDGRACWWGLKSYLPPTRQLTGHRAGSVEFAASS